VVEAAGAQFRVTRSLHPVESAALSGLLAWCRTRGVTALTQALHNPHTLRARMRKLRLDWSQYRAGVK
jgi:hypothetical protein